MDDYERDRHWRRLAINFAANNPGRVLALAAKKQLRFWYPVPNLRQFQTTFFCIVLGVPYGVAMLFALWGLARSWRRGDVALILVLPVAYHALVHMVFVGSVRYRIAVMPMVVVLAAHALAALGSRWRGTPEPSSPKEGSCP
jgi:hypothetical protein